MTTERHNAEAPLYRYRFGSAEFDEARFELRVAGLAVELERKPLEVLAALLRHCGEVVTRDELIDSVWAGRVTVDNVLPNAVAKLRKALGEANAELILTQPRVGYRLTGAVERVAVGRRFASRLDLAAGQTVTGREHFVLQRQLGASRGSEVWLARHVKTREERVYKFSIDGARLGALKREATISRLLREGLGERDDFVHVVDWNFEQPPFFLECPYGGQSLAEWNEAGHLKAMPLQARVALFLQIADAVAAAHSLGVLHKDLKPANVLIAPREKPALTPPPASAGGPPLSPLDGERGDSLAARDASSVGWQVRLTDFGSGRLLEPERLAELGITQLGLTLTQDGSSTTGTPLYIAPEIIAGGAPTVQSDVYALGLLLYQIVAADLKKPMASGWDADIAQPLLCEDIAAATEGNPARRLASAAELAARLRGLDQRTAERERERDAALRAERAERALERSRARRPWVAAAMVAMLAGIVISTWLYQQADRERDHAQRQTALAQAAYSFLRDDIIGAIDPAKSGKAGITIQEAVNGAAPRIGTRFASEPEVQSELYRLIGLVNQRTVAHEAALENYAKALEIAQARYGPASEQCVALHAEQVLSLVQLSRFDDAKAALEQAERGFEALQAPSAETTYAVHMARGHYETLALTRWDQAVEAYSRAIDAAERDPRFSPARLLGAYSQKGTNLARAGRDTEALELLEAAQRRAERMNLRDNAAQLRIQRLGTLVKAQRFDEALALAEETEPMVVEVRGPESGWLSDVLILKAYLRDETRHPEAGEAYDEAADVRQRLLGPDNVYVTEARRYAGWAYRTAGKPELAMARLESAHTDFHRIVGANSPYTNLAALMYALVLLDMSRDADAERVLAQVDPAKAEHGEGLAALVRGRLLLRRGQAGAAREALELALKLLDGNGDRRYREEARRELATLDPQPQKKVN